MVRSSNPWARGQLIPAVLLTLLLLYPSSPARADAIPPPPADCPEGSHGDSCHGGEYCAPSRCSGDTDCSGDASCEPRELCTSRIDCAGGWDPDAAPFYQDTVTGSCAGGAACTSGTCETVRVCVPASATGTGATAAAESQVVEQGCGCRLAQPLPGADRSNRVAVALLTWIGWRRRVRQRTRGRS